ncbi:hypothetical protein MNBD_GAMMA26-2308 [hydrothermal vent metagenome]|uniref:Sel1 repeat family protein n=1 Tax=hydrothermal vent metagenome TaxID=652676 RepID=A0A3B1AT35_9ZZZZ
MNTKALLLIVTFIAVAAVSAYFLLFSTPATPPSLIEAPTPKVAALTWEQLLESLADKPAIEIRQHGVRFFQDRDPDKAFLLFKQAAKKDDGWSAMVIGEMYDPATFTAEDFDPEKTAFSKPNPGKALQWYDLAIKHGEGKAKSRQERLISLLQAEADAGDAKAQRLLRKREPQ